MPIRTASESHAKKNVDLMMHHIAKDIAQININIYPYTERERKRESEGEREKTIHKRRWSRFGVEGAALATIS